MTDDDKVERIAEFPKGCNIAQFLGKGYDDAIKEANAWQSRTGHNCLKYYEQKLVTRWHSIIVYYERKENKNELQEP